VDSVLNGPLDELVDQDIQVVLDGSTAFVDTLDCLICWTFIAEGTARMHGSTGTMHAIRVEQHLRPDCCDHSAGLTGRSDPPLKMQEPRARRGSCPPIRNTDQNTIF